MVNVAFPANLNIFSERFDYNVTRFKLRTDYWPRTTTIEFVCVLQKSETKKKQWIENG